MKRMGINISPSLLLNEDTFDISTLCSVPVIESYYLPCLDMIHEVNTMIRNSHLELYKIIEMDEDVALDPVQEANIINTFVKKIGEIFDKIIQGIKKIKDFIVAQITKVINKVKMKIEKKVMDQIKKLPDLYNEDQYFTLDLYSNVLKDTLTNPNIPDRDLIFTNKNFDHFLDKINTPTQLTFNDDALKNYSARIKAETERDRRDLRSALAGVKSTTEDLNDIVAFKKQLSNFYIGEQTSRRVDRAFLSRAIENIGNYSDMLTKMTTVKNEIDKKYNDLMVRINKIRKQSNDNLSTMKGDTSYNADYFTQISNTVISLSNMVNGYLQDHMTAYMVKLDCIIAMQNQDIDIVNRVKNLVYKTNNESYVIERELEDGMEQAFTEYCEGCFLLKEHVERVHLTAFVNESVYLTEADKDPNFVSRIIEMITSMFKKFLTNLNQLIGVDKKWFEQNEQKIKGNDFVFPGKENIGEWVPYRREMLEKPFNIPVFNMDDHSILDNLKDDETFAKFLFNKIGANENMIQGDDANGSFANKCKAIYAGGEAKEISPADLTKDKDGMFDYCKNYNQGEGGGIYKSIVADTNKLDQSKKAVMRALNSYKPEAKPAETNTETNPNDANKPTNDANKPAENAPKDTSATPKEENTLDIVSLFGITESTNILQELTTPDIAKEDKDGMKENIKAGGGDSDEGMKTLKEKATRYFTMTGNALGAKMTASMQCYKQYKQIFKWALKATTDRPTTNADTTAKPDAGKEQPADTSGGESIAAAAKK